MTVNKASTRHSLATCSDQKKCSEHQVNLKFKRHKTGHIFPQSKILLYQTSVIKGILESLKILSSILLLTIKLPFSFDVLVYLLIFGFDGY